MYANTEFCSSVSFLTPFLGGVNIKCGKDQKALPPLNVFAGIVSEQMHKIPPKRMSQSRRHQIYTVAHKGQKSLQRLHKILSKLYKILSKLHKILSKITQNLIKNYTKSLFLSNMAFAQPERHLYFSREALDV